MPLFGKFLALTFLIIPFLFLWPVFAQEQYFFQEEFNEERSAGILNPNKWIVYPNKRTQPDHLGCMFDTVNETGGLLILKQCAGTPQFPYVVSKTNPVPDGDFTATIRFQFPGAGGLPTGIKFVDRAPGNGEGYTELFGVGFEEDVFQNSFRIEYKNTIVFSKDEDSGYYIFGLQKENDIYKIYFNNQLVFTSPPTAEKIGALYIGNPAILPSPGYGWSRPRIDYIRVIDNGPSEIIPEPFLDLPWDYSNSGKDFKQIVFNPYSWFDHKYPLQNFCCDPPVLYYKGELKNDKLYKSHSGYDYSSPQGVDRHTLVLAAASGSATFVHKDNSKGGGNMIKIDHGNGYQTWYEHLEEATPGSELIVKEEGLDPKKVTKGQVIGRVGLTGNTTGYHIHFSVFKDINDNDDFSDDKPFGLVDPLGWEGDYTDPWEEYSVTDENKVTRHGAKSYKLFNELSPPKTQSIPPAGGTIINDEFTMNIPPGSVSQNANFKIDFGSFEKASNFIKSIVPSLFLSASNNLGTAIADFNNPLGLIYNYSKADLSNVNEDSISFYFFNKETNAWEKILSVLNKTDKTISTQTNHFSQFAVMAELLDSTPPTTTTEIIGDKGAGNWYRSNVKVKLVADDNPGGKGISYSVYSLDGENWNKYEAPLEFIDEGLHKIYFLSHDNVGNQESIKNVEFSIDKTIPEAKIAADLSDYDLKVTPVSTDPVEVTKKPGKKLNESTYLLTDKAGNTLTLETYDLDSANKDSFKLYSLKYNSGNSIPVATNLFNATYTFQPNPKRIRIISQTFDFGNQAKFTINADAFKNKTFLSIIENRKPRKEEKSGIVLLNLQTNKGKLEYSY